MNKFNVIVVMNEAMLKLLKYKNDNYDRNLKIKKYLEDEAIFFKISKLNAYEILRNVGVREENLDNIYEDLTSPNMFYNLLNKWKYTRVDKMYKVFNFSCR